MLGVKSIENSWPSLAQILFGPAAVLCSQQQSINLIPRFASHEKFTGEPKCVIILDLRTLAGTAIQNKMD